MRFGRLLLIITVLFSSFSCTTAKRTSSSASAASGKLRFINEYVVPFNMQYKGTTVGGLSGIDYDEGNGIYYLVCDDRSDRNPARFYKAKIHIRESRIDSVEFTDMITLLDEAGKPYPNKRQDSLRTPDPESIRYNPETNELIWSSEGDRLMRTVPPTLVQPGIYYIDPQGRYKSAFEMPDNLRMQTIQKGPRQNGVLEGISFSKDYQYVFASVEEPLHEDGRRAGTGDSTAWVRFLKFDIQTKKQVAQYAYQIDAVPHPPVPPGGSRINGISEILCIGNEQFIVIERSFSAGQNGNGVRIYLADAKNAENIASVTSLEATPASRPMTKQLLLNMDDLGRYIDNVEGVCFGPKLPNGHRSLIFVTDDNFESREKTQFFLFEFIP